MAKKYGGQYSPESENFPKPQARVIEENPKIRAADRRLKLYRILAGVMGFGGLVRLMSGDPIAGLTSVAAFFAVVFSTEVIKAGLKAEQAYDQRNIARAPALPRKSIGAALIALTFLIEAKFGVGTDWLTAIGLAIAGGVGSVLAFGLDPMKSKGISTDNRYAAHRAADAIERAQNYLDEIRSLSRQMGNRRAQLEVESLALSAEEMFRALEEDPQDYRNSRRYLGVYLQGARDATSQYIALPKVEHTAEAEAKYLALVRELDAGFQKQREAILDDNRNALNVEIDVLRERLASEGVVIPSEEEK